MITVNDHHDVLHAVIATKVRGTVKYNAIEGRSEITLAYREDVQATMQELLNVGWVAQCSHNDRKSFFVVGAVVSYP